MLAMLRLALHVQLVNTLQLPGKRVPPVTLMLQDARVSVPVLAMLVTFLMLAMVCNAQNAHWVPQKLQATSLHAAHVLIVHTQLRRGKLDAHLVTLMLWIALLLVLVLVKVDTFQIMAMVQYVLFVLPVLPRAMLETRKGALHAVQMHMRC